MWLIFGFLGVLHAVRQARFPLKVSAWSLIFPNVSESSRYLISVSSFRSFILQGVYAIYTITLCRGFDAKFFRVREAICFETTPVL